MEARRGQEGESFAASFAVDAPGFMGLIRRISGERLYESGSTGDRDMPDDEQVHEEWHQLLQDWRSVWESWNEVMDRITLAFSQSGNPSDDDLALEDRLHKQLLTVEERRHELRRELLLTQPHAAR